MNRNRVNLPKKCNPTNKINKVHVTKALYYILVSLLSLLFVYIIMFTIKYLITGCYLRQNYFSYLLSLDFNKPCISKKKSASYLVRKIEDDKEVFHIGNQNYTYKQAKCKCESYNSKLATKNQLIKAYNKGANWCTYGWTDGQHAYYPVQKCSWDKLQKGPKKHRFSCGRPGINGGFFANPMLKFGANCYGIKPKGSVVKPKAPKCTKPPFCQREVNRKAAKKLDTDRIMPFNDDQWSQFK